MGRSSGITVFVCRDCQGTCQVNGSITIYRQDVGKRNIACVEGTSCFALTLHFGEL